MYNLENMPKYKAMRKAKKRWKDLEKKMDELFKLEELNEYLVNLTEYQKEAQILRHLEYLSELSTAFCTFTLEIVKPLTTEEELAELEKMTHAERRAFNKTMHFYFEIRKKAEQANKNAKLSREYLERLKKSSN